MEDEQSTLDAFIQMFFAKEEDAKKEEASTDDILTNSTDAKKEPKDSQGSSSQESAKNSQESNKDSDSLQDIIDKLIQTAGKHMESSMIAAHLSLLIAYLVMEDPVRFNSLLLIQRRYLRSQISALPLSFTSYW